MLCALLLVVQKPVTEIRDYVIEAKLGTGGKLTMTRTVDTELKTMSIRSLTRWDDKTILDERLLFNGDGLPVEYSQLIEQNGKKLPSFYKIENGKGAREWTSSAGTKAEGKFEAPKGRYEDASVWWFVNQVPAPGDTVRSNRANVVLADEPARTVFVGTKVFEGREVPLVRRFLGDPSLRVDIYLDEKGMPLRREFFYNENSASPYRVDRLAKK